MKLLHFADLHLGIERHGATDPVTGLSSRLGDFLGALDRVVDAAIREEVDAVLFAGDAFKNRDPTPTVQREFARRIRRLVEAAIPIVILIGNHDLPNAWGRATAVEIFPVLAVPGVWIADRIGTLRLTTRSGPLQVVHLPWITRSHVLGREEYRAMDMEEAQGQLLQAVAELVGQEAAALDPAVPAVLLAHGTVQGATYGSERTVMLGQDLVFSRADLSAPAFDYIALGHVHKHQVVGQHPPMVYAGSPERIDFGEEHEEKGYVLVEIGPGGQGEHPVDWHFQRLPARPFRSLTLRAHGSDPLGDLLRVIEHSHDLEQCVVRLTVRVAPEAEGQIRPLDLRRALRAAGASYVAGIKLEPEQQERRARLALDSQATLSPLQLLGLYLEARQIPAPRARRLLDLAATLAPEMSAAPSAPRDTPGAESPGPDQDI
jgi:exonuclease SbcD